MTTGSGDGDSGTGPKCRKPLSAEILDAIADAWWVFRLTFSALRARWSK